MPAKMTMSSYTPSSSDDESDGGDPMVQPTKETALARTAMPSLLPVKEPRRKSGFDLFCASERARVVGPSGADAMKKLGAAWGKLSPKEKDEWKERATHTNLAAGVATTHGSVVDRPPVTTPTPSSSVSAVATAKQATATVTNPKNVPAVDLPLVPTPAPNSSVNTVATAKQATANVTNPKSVAGPKELDLKHPALSNLSKIQKGEHVDKIKALVSPPSNKTWDQICGLGAICSEVKDTMQFAQATQGWPGILLFGLPGTGKSSIGEVVASQLNRTFFLVKPKDLEARHIQALFAVARAMEPSVIFFEEANAMLQGDASSKKNNAIAMAIKAEWQSNVQEDVVIMAATNSPHQLESANLERFTGGKFLVPLPNPAARRQILERLLKAQNLRDGENWELKDKAWEFIKKCTGGYSGRDLALTLYPAALRGPLKDAQREGLDPQKAPLRAITFKDIKKAMKKINVTPDAKLEAAISKFNEEHGTKAEVLSSASDDEDSDDDVDSTKLCGREAGAGGSGTVRHDVQQAIAQEEDCAKQRAKAQAVALAAPRPMCIESVSDRTNQEEAFASDPEEDIPIKDLRKRHLRTQSNTKPVATEPKPDSDEDMLLTDRKHHLRTQSSARPVASDPEDELPLQTRKRTRTKKGSGTVRTAALMSAAAASGAMTVENADEHERGLGYGANAPEKAAANMAAFAPAATVANASSDPSDLKGALQCIYKAKSDSRVRLHDVFNAIANEHPVIWEQLSHPRRPNQKVINEEQRRRALSDDPNEYSTLVNELFENEVTLAFPGANFKRVVTSDGKTKEKMVIGITQKA